MRRREFIALIGANITWSHVLARSTETSIPRGCKQEGQFSRQFLRSSKTDFGLRTRRIAPGPFWGTRLRWQKGRSLGRVRKAPARPTKREGLGLVGAAQSKAYKLPTP